MKNNENKKYGDLVGKIVFWFFIAFFGAVMIEKLISPETNYIGSAFVEISVLIILCILVAVIVWAVFWNPFCFSKWCYYNIKALILNQKSNPQSLREFIKQVKEYKIDRERLRNINERFSATTGVLTFITLFCSAKYGLPYIYPYYYFYLDGS